jgi:hypothetical protein
MNPSFEENGLHLGNHITTLGLALVSTSWIRPKPFSATATRGLNIGLLRVS